MFDLITCDSFLYCASTRTRYECENMYLCIHACMGVACKCVCVCVCSWVCVCALCGCVVMCVGVCVCVQVLLCLEGASRGLDFKKVDIVINASPPPNTREYVHRAGRTARNGAVGTVVTMTAGDKEAVEMNRCVCVLGLYVCVLGLYVCVWVCVYVCAGFVWGV